MNIKKLAASAVKSLGALLLVIASALFPLLTANANAVPRFNQMEGDLEFLTGRNLTRNEADFHDPVDASAEETVRIRVYYHNNASQENGDPGDAAINTRIKINLPTGTGTTHIVSGSVGADNTETVSGTIVNGQEVGDPGLRINTDTLTSLNYVPGSVRWFPNRNDAGAPVPLPNGQTGDEIITDQGILLGNIEGCWQFSGFVTLDVSLADAGEAKIEQAKAAFNETQGNVDATKVSANPGDVIRYELITRNTGTAEIANYPIEDNISDILVYANVTESAPGTIESRSNGTFIVYPAQTIAAGTEVKMTFKVQVKPAAEWGVDNFIMTNVYGNVVDVPVNPPVAEVKITIDKAVRNLTQSNTDYGFEVRGVKNGDSLEYLVIVENKGQKAITKVTVKDRHDNRLKFQSGSATLTRNGVTTAIVDDIIGNGYVLDSALKTGERVEFRYRMTADNSANEDRCLANTATASGEGVGEVKDDASACVVKVTQPVTPDAAKPTAVPTTPTPTVTVMPEDQPAKLPTTGPVSSSFALLGLVGSGATTVRYRKAQAALRKAQKDISVI